MTNRERIEMTSGCRDADSIPKVADAGNVTTGPDGRIQTMHNGVKVVADGYCGDWMTDIITRLNGHHEPQEELLFHELLKHVRPDSFIVELGAYWAYYSCWYLSAIPGSRAVCIEPNAEHARIGRKNIELNRLEERVEYKQAWIGKKGDGLTAAADSLECLDMDDLVRLAGGRIELLHVDIQGAETPLLRTMRDAVENKCIRFLVVSTHHESISGSPTTHDDCIHAIKKLGGTILAEHSVEESFSGDGLVVASFRSEDANLRMPAISVNLPGYSLFPPSPQRLISYAQNFEDIMLWRALKHVRKGFYVDVGANHPERDSVTKLFYDRGWSGINIEPGEAEFHSVQDARPRDINLRVLAGATAGEAKFFYLGADASGLSTMDEAMASRHIAAGYPARESILPVKPLEQILDEHDPGEIHFLKIDVEGAERVVLEGIAFKSHRPWVVLLESMQPQKQVPCHEDWEFLLLENDYLFAYADGLNRFYVAKERPELLASFQYPPNVFDDVFTLARDANLNTQIDAERHRERELCAKLDASQHRERKLRAKLDASLQREMKLRDQLDKGPFRIRQLMRHPKQFLREIARNLRK